MANAGTQYETIIKNHICKIPGESRSIPGRASSYRLITFEECAQSQKLELGYIDEGVFECA